MTPAPSSGYRRWLNHPAVRELLQIPASFLQADTGDARASRIPTSRLLLLVGSTAELERIDVAKLHKEISGACAGAAATKKRSREVVAQPAAQHHKWCPPLSDLRKKIDGAHRRRMLRALVGLANLLAQVAERRTPLVMLRGRLSHSLTRALLRRCSTSERIADLLVKLLATSMRSSTERKEKKNDALTA